MKAAADAVALAGRLLLAFLFVSDGAENWRHYDDVASYMQAGGVDPRLLPLVLLTLLGGGLLVATGLFARWAAAALAAFCIATAFLFHTGADAGEAIQLQKDLAIAGGLLMLVAFGPGGWSLDALWARRRAAL